MLKFYLIVRDWRLCWNLVKRAQCQLETWTLGTVGDLNGDLEKQPVPRANRENGTNGPGGQHKGSSGRNNIMKGQKKQE